MDHLPDSSEVRELVKDADHNFSVNLLDKTAPLATDAGADYEGKLYWDYVKWYDGYDEVGFIEEFLESIPDEDYRFIRLGEDSDDNEERGEYFDSDIYISRSISW